jgi:SAM-dependent methyltransferase
MPLVYSKGESTMVRKLLFLSLFPTILLSMGHIAFMASSPRAESAWDIGRDVPFVPTPDEVVAEMLRLADVRASDLVYDLGCGDGRIVISAVKDKGAKGVGVDIDPQRIQESRRNADQAGVSDRVEFIVGDLFTVDFSDATVVALYLLPDVNLRLRPKLFDQLQPGTRIVSHAFDMEEWKPDETSSVGPNVVYYWILPANASGEWSWSGPEPGGEHYRLQLVQHFQEVNGVLRTGSAVYRVGRASLEGDRLMLTVETGSERPVTLEGRVQGDVIEGTMNTGGKKVPWRAVREPDTMSRVDKQRPDN